MAPVSAATKYDTAPPQSRTSNSSGNWNRQQSYRAPQHDTTERKQLLAAPVVPPSQDRRLVQAPALNPIHPTWPVDSKLSKLQKSYGIYPSLTSDIYIYERSITSASFDDELASSPSSDSSSSDSDHFARTATYASVEVSSTRASSSTETLESTLTARAPAGTHPNAVAPLAIAAAPRPPSTRPRHDSTSAARPVIPLTRAQSQLQRSISVSRVVPPIPLASAPLENLSDSSDSDTAVSDTHIDGMVVDMLGAPLSGPSSYGYPGRNPPSFRTRRDSTDRVPSNSYRRDAPSASSRDLPAARSVAPPPHERSQRREDSPRADDQAYPRAPPGLTSGGAAGGGVATVPDGSPPRWNSDPSPSFSSNGSPTARSAGSAPALARTTSTRPGPAIPFPGPQAPARSAVAVPPSIPPAAASPTTASPPRRDTRTPSPQNTSPAGSPTTHSPTQGCPTSAIGPGALVVAPKRNVRWNDNLVCPSPVPLEQRRKGWFNRRGDQLWTNDGQYKVPAQGQEFPPDLALYPEPNTGWMNEEGVRIDMQHRLIPKQPLRPALKRRTL
ncbi:hypothetical protein BD310DRAFT_981600 [Dichomitus squalens]|uniref:Uncharacterized protein n=1 Tax=Dichomitus squalens TaxID=114155 RepID=A0A4V2K6M4_9APHY|nr:hypothetical protein BD310DRAFT_981600 [Dichomitus squalens]